MSDKRLEKGQKDNGSENSFNTRNLFLDFFFVQKIKQWWASTFIKLIAGLGIIVLFIELVVGICEVSEIFGWNWCDKENAPVVKKGDKPEKTKKIVVPPPETIDKQAHRLFNNNNSANLQVKISPSTLNVGESMYMHFKTNSDGYLLVLNINSQGALSQLIPRISQEKPSYLKLNKDQERIIPDPDDPSICLSLLLRNPLVKKFWSQYW